MNKIIKIVKMLKILYKSLILLLITGSMEILLLNKSNLQYSKKETTMKNAHLILHSWLVTHLNVDLALKKLLSTTSKPENVLSVKEPLFIPIRKESVYRLVVAEDIITTLIKENVSAQWLNLMKQPMENVYLAYCLDSGMKKLTLVIAVLNLQSMFQLKIDVLHVLQTNHLQLVLNVLDALMGWLLMIRLKDVLAQPINHIMMDINAQHAISLNIGMWTHSHANNVLQILSSIWIKESVLHVLLTNQE